MTTTTGIIALPSTEPPPYCPQCGADPETLLGMLREGRASENHWIARTMRRNCEGCRAGVSRLIQAELVSCARP